MKKVFVYGIAVLALAAAPATAQVIAPTPGQSITPPDPGSGGATDQGGSRPGSGLAEPDEAGARGVEPDSPAGQNRAPAETAANDAAVPGATDRSFIVEAAHGGLAEVELGRMAAEKAANARVKQFAQRMVADHGKANDQLNALAGARTITLPAQLDAQHKATRDRLAGLSGDAFDQAYMRLMVADHRADVAAFQQEAANGRDAEVKAWAGKILPTLQQHLTMAQEISKSLGNRAVGTAGEHAQQPGAAGSAGGKNTPNRPR